MIDWEQLLARPQLVCAVSAVPITPGQRFYSLLRWQDGRFHRADVSEDYWDEALAKEAVSWWRQQRAVAQEAHGPRLLGNETLYTIFSDCAHSSDRPRQCMAWLLAWLLIRQRFLRYHDLIEDEENTYLVVQRRGSGQPLQRIRDPHLSEEEQGLLQQQMEELFTQGA